MCGSDVLDEVFDCDPSLGEDVGDGSRCPGDEPSELGSLALAQHPPVRVARSIEPLIDPALIPVLHPPSQPIKASVQRNNQLR